VPPRSINGQTLLTGMAKCGTCGGGMTIRIGKGGRYRYYTYNNRVNEGATTCKGRNIPITLLDGLVTGAMEARLFAPDRLPARAHRREQTGDETAKLDCKTFRADHGGTALNP
jgi:ssDNA-binding Zn-finger/Zn-ribbon topoisomerase 1